METVQALPTKKRRKKRRRAPRYHVVLWNDDDHTFDYVVIMLKAIFGYPAARGFEFAKEVHIHGKAIVFTSSLEQAELKRDMILSFGPDPFMPENKGSVPIIATIQKVCGEQ